MVMDSGLSLSYAIMIVLSGSTNLILSEDVMSVGVPRRRGSYIAARITGHYLPPARPNLDEAKQR